MIKILDKYQNIKIFQIGCGGTGSWLTPLVSKLVGNVQLNFTNTNIEYTLIDHDIVEQRNIIRQNFNEWDIGKNKALALTSHNIYNFNKLEFIKNKIQKKSLDEILTESIEIDDVLIFILGCVDSNRTRRIIYNVSKDVNLYMKKNRQSANIVYIDSGNLLYNGQIVTTVFGLEDYPNNNHQNINFLKMFPAKKVEEETKSCAFFGDQSQAINSLAATLMYCCFQKILINSEIPPSLITFNSSGYSTFEI
ncbi:ThiF family adenylyltransferase [archaeon]|nr:ThiF family adenylyltransferase [archaeon]MCK9439397.1 ThiF family adenylyltransferase [Patescibacteria group bacterium]